jgi:carbonic anhydrase
MKSKFATAINCIDGRVQIPVAEFIKNNYHVDYVDMITVPGPDRVLSESADIDEIESVKKKVLISCDRHESRLIFVAGHYDCAANPCDEKTHRLEIRRAAENMKKWNTRSEVYGIWVDRSRKAVLV